MGSPQRIVPNFIFFDFSDFAFHNEGQLNIRWRDVDDDSLPCAPDAELAFPDSLQMITHELQKGSSETKRSAINLLKKSKSATQFKKLLAQIKDASFEKSEHERHLEAAIGEHVFNRLKLSNGSKISAAIIEGLHDCTDYDQYMGSVKNKFPKSASKNEQEEELYNWLLGLLRCIPQPWNALGAGRVTRYLFAGEQSLVKSKHAAFPALLVKDVSKRLVTGDHLPEEYNRIVQQIQLYLEYALLFNEPKRWGEPVKPVKPVSAIFFPILDDGFFRGLIFVVSTDKKEIDEIWCNKKQISIYREKCSVFAESIRNAVETLLFNKLLSSEQKSDTEQKLRYETMYEKFLRYCCIIQEVSLGSLWVKNQNEFEQTYVTGYGRKERETKDKGTPGIFSYRKYNNYEEFFKIKEKAGKERWLNKKEERLIAKVRNQFDKNKSVFYDKYPRVTEDDDFTKNLAVENCHSYYNTKGLEIRWRMTLPIIQKGEIVAVYFFYYRDPIVANADTKKFELLSLIEDKEQKEQHKQQIFTARARQIIKFFSTIEVHEKSKQEILRHSTRAAIAAIMGRNMSHNIGSHVLSHLSELTKGEIAAKGYGFGFYKYLQGRSDFLAEISTTEPVWTMQMRLFDDLLSPFVYSDLQTKKGELLDNIGRSTYVDKDGKRIYLDASKIEIVVLWDSYRVTYNYNIEESSFEMKMQEAYFDNGETRYKTKNIDDLRIELPHGLMGAHAFYSILENFIRNSIRHNNEKIASKLNDFKFRLKIIIHLEPAYSDELIKVCISDNVSDYSYEAKSKIDRYINGEMKALVKDDGSLNKEGGWGIKEMRLSAAWLRNLSPETIQFSDTNPSVLTVDKYVGANGISSLSFNLYLLKPFNVLIVGNDGLEAYPDKGIYTVAALHEVDKLLTSGKLIHKFVIFNIPGAGEWLINNLLRLSSRVFVVKKNTTDSESNKIVFITDEEYRALASDMDYLMPKVYEKWVEHIFAHQIFPEITILKDNATHNAIKSLMKGRNVSDKKIILEHAADKVPDSGKCLYWEQYSTAMGKGTLGGKLKIIRDADVILKLITLYELYEAALTNIVIVDERLFNRLDKKIKYKDTIETTLHELLRCWKIDVINMKQMNEEIFVDNWGQSNEKWDHYINNKELVSFLSIHQTIVRNIGEKLFFEKLASHKKILNTVIHSGRGSVDITPGFKFIEFSNLEQLIVNAPDKHLLTDLFMGIKGVKNE